ncbi:glycosyltransferase [Shouchella tritolerans]|uniref:glycosyltransferase n=1 Tax=Shouchella tritolerans TaxID=2979466 RepID=UPI0021E90623|nr:glycosyltransferase [Shouchella tritolerans]
MIVKNEEHTLEKCLSSVEGIPDEIIIVDTGSTDQTKEIAKKWTPHVYDFQWIDDFSAARNASFQYATQDYIFWLDADDILEPEQRDKFLQLKSSLPEDVDAISMRYFIPQDVEKSLVSQTVRFRLVKRSKGFRWKGIVHEDLAIDGSYRFLNTDITVTHTKVMSDPNQIPSRRNIEIYERRLANGYRLTVSDMFHYARECIVQKQFDKAIEYFEKCKDHPEISLENNMFIHHKLATSYAMENQPEKELELTLQSLALDVPYPAFSCRMGEHFLRKGHIEAAIFWYKTAYKQPLSERYAWSVADTVYQTWLPHQQLALCYQALGDQQQAHYHEQQAEFYKNHTSTSTHNVTPSFSMTAPKERLNDTAPSQNEVIIYRGQHADTYTFSQSTQFLVRKQFHKTREGSEAFNNEKLASERFHRFPWFSQREMDNQQRAIVMEMYPFDHRLDAIAHVLTDNGRQIVIGQVMSMILDLFVEGFAHRDIHAKNIFFHHDRIKLIDYEFMIPYPEGEMPSFINSYDITGKGLESPYNTKNMGFLGDYPLSVSNVLHISLEGAISALKTELVQEITAVSADFQKKEGRHRHPFLRPYCSFTLQNFQVSSTMAQRNSARRLEQFKLHKKEIVNKTLLDIGSHCGGMIFETQKLQPKSCLGIEYDQDKVHVARKVAAFSDLNHVRFIQGDIDKLTKEELGGTFDVVYCLAMEAHVKNPERLYQLLGEVTNELLLFEGNATTNVQEVEIKLTRAGFTNVVFLGFCDDDFMAANNDRPLFKARK